MEMTSKRFIEALQNHNLDEIKRVPKSDLHNHFVLGGDRKFIKEKTGIDISPYKGIMHSMDEMHKWFELNMGEKFNCLEMRQLLIDATIIQAAKDGIHILEIGEDVWGLDEYFQGNIKMLIDGFTQSQKKYGEQIELRLQIGMSRHCSIKYLEKCLEQFWDEKSFHSIDLYGDEKYQPIENFKEIYQKAKSKGLKLKAHVGEWGNSDDVRTAIEVLELDEVQHGISAVNSKEVMKYLRENKIRLNLTPTSNVVLGRVENFTKHPIGELYNSGIDVTINSDDILIFDSDVSKEYLRLYESGVLTADELDDIRKNGLR